MPDQIKSAAQWRLLQAKAHANPRMERRYSTKGPSRATAQKMLADNPVDVSKLPQRVRRP